LGDLKMKKAINEEKIVKQIEIINTELKKMNNYLTTKGIVSLVINLVEEQLNEKNK
jgi:hypothetical protein